MVGNFEVEYRGHSDEEGVVIEIGSAAAEPGCKGPELSATCEAQLLEGCSFGGRKEHATFERRAVVAQLVEKGEVAVGYGYAVNAGRPAGEIHRLDDLELIQDACQRRDDGGHVLCPVDLDLDLDLACAGAAIFGRQRSARLVVIVEMAQRGRGRCRCAVVVGGSDGQQR